MSRMEQELDDHLMKETMRTFRMKAGTKFDIIGDVQFQKDVLESHNQIRTKFGVPSLSWCQELGDQAQHWAERLAEKGHMLYSELPGIGENISFVPLKDYSDLPSGEEVAQMWLAESEHYNYDKPGWLTTCKHFTQMVWRASREVGVGRAITPDHSKLVIVAFYKPGGNTNYPGDFERNVPRGS